MDNTTIANLLILGCNLIVLGLNLKVYTEYVKDKSINSKRKSNEKRQGKNRFFF